MRASLFITCLTDTLFPEVGPRRSRLLERLGVEVDFPLEQTCCGQMHFNTGYAREAIPLVRRFVRTFGDSGGGRVALGLVRRDGARALPALAARSGDAALAAEVEALAAARASSSREFLVDRLGVEDVGARFPHRVTYHPSCHGQAAARRRRARCGCCARCAGSTSSSCPSATSAAASAARSRSRTPTLRRRC